MGAATDSSTTPSNAVELIESRPPPPTEGMAADHTEVTVITVEPPREPHESAHHTEVTVITVEPPTEPHEWAHEDPELTALWRDFDPDLLSLWGERVSAARQAHESVSSLIQAMSAGNDEDAVKAGGRCGRDITALRETNHDMPYYYRNGQVSKAAASMRSVEEMTAALEVLQSVGNDMYPPFPALSSEVLVEDGGS